MPSRRAALAALSLLPLLARAQAPNGPVRLVHPYPGGLVDNGARALADVLAPAWNQPVVVEGKPGANELLAADTVAKSARDGRTLLIATEAAMVNNLYLYEKLPFDPQRDLVALAELFRVRFGLVVRGDLPVGSLSDFIALMKKDGARYSYGSSGNGGPLHLAMESFRRTAGFEMTHVPYKTIAQLAQDLLGGRVDAVFISVPFALPFLSSGKLKVLAVTGATRLEVAPSIPSFAELGFPGVDYATSVALLAPAGVPQQMLATIGNDVRTAARSDAFRQKFLAPNGLEVGMTDGAQFAAALAARRQATQRLIQALGLPKE